MPLNLDTLVPVVEGYMLDTITITRTEDQDRHWDPVTGTYTAVARLIYSGKAFVSAMGSPGEQTYGGEEMHRTYYEIGAPRSMPLVKVNDKIRVDVSLNDKLLPGTVLCVEGIIPTTFTVHRRITAYADQSGS